MSGAYQSDHVNVKIMSTERKKERKINRDNRKRRKKKQIKKTNKRENIKTDNTKLYGNER